MRQGRGFDAYTPAGFFLILLQVLIFSDEVHQNGAVQVFQVISPVLNGSVDMVMVWSIRIKLPPYEGFKIRDVRQQLGAFPPKVVPRADL